MPVKKESSSTRKLVNSKTRITEKKRASESTSKRVNELSVQVYSLAGKESGTLALPKEIFGQKVNKQLLSQAMRVYVTNQKVLPGSTKTRGEVVGSTAKIFRQKGTGRARHGAVRAPIFVGGGIALGPKPRKVRLDLSKKMKKAALFAALSAKVADKSIMGLGGVEKAAGKTKEIFEFLNEVGGKNKGIRSALIVTDKKIDNMARSARNIPGVSVLSVNMINVYEVLRHELLVVTKEAIERLSTGEQK